MARPRVHLGLAVAVLALLGRRMTWPERGAFLAGGVLVDGDHLVDLALQRQSGRRRWLVLPLHGWEFALLGLLTPARGLGPALTRAAALGLLLHLVADQIANQPAEAALYSFGFRLARRFDAERLVLKRGDGSWVHRPWWQWL
jgi:hypothetical protein